MERKSNLRTITFIGHDHSKHCSDCHNPASYRIDDAVTKTRFYACNLCVDNWIDEEEDEE